VRTEGDLRETPDRTRRRAVDATGSAPPAVSGSDRPPWLLRFLGWLLKPWIRYQCDPPDVARRVPAARVVYVLEREGLSSLLILEHVCRERGLPSPFAPLLPASPRLRSWLAVFKPPRLFRRGRSFLRSRRLQLILERHAEGALSELMLVPVSVFVGRAPQRERGWFRVLFAENWVLTGRFRRFLAVLLNGRDTYVRFGAPIALKESLGDLPPDKARLRLARALRLHFRNVRSAVIGPDLSHRRTLIGELLRAPAVRTAIAQTAEREKVPAEKVARRARRYAWEIAADYSHPVVRSLYFLLTAFWNRIYEGVSVNHFETVREIAPGREMVYVPCHRSHIDYLLLSYVLYVRGLVPPHIAAGINLNLPLLGPLLRRGGAFFLRRSFKANALYSAVFSEYVAALVRRGVALEYFIEGGRSRTGRLLAPRLGMLGITVRGALAAPRRPVVFQPVYFGYEKVFEVESYIGELSGQPKRRESWWGLLRALRILRRRHGTVTVNFGEPVPLEELLDERLPGWRDQARDDAARPGGWGSLLEGLGRRILENINRAADVNPMALLALALLSAPKAALPESDLAAHLELLRDFLRTVPFSDRVTVCEQEARAIIARGEALGMLRRIAHPLGDVIAMDERQAVLASYYRNNVLHLIADAAWVALCFSNNRRMSRAAILRLGRLVYPYVRNELFLPWEEDGWSDRLEAVIRFYVERGLLFESRGGRVLAREAGQSDGAFRLRLIARGLLQVFERYYLALSVLVKNGSGALSMAEVEQLCHLTAQRLTLVYEMNAPEYFDRSLFRAFLQELKNRGVVSLDDGGRLCFGAELPQLVEDARLILRRELRHAVQKLSPEARARLGEASRPAE
jgi:glycerol-3-phosphate O-acyltransferase